jgi:hypothetical protein
MIQWYAVILWCGVAVRQVNFKRSDHLVWSLLACSFSFSCQLFNILLEVIRLCLGSVQNVCVFA